MAESSPTPSVRACVVGMTDVGKVREHNEDAFLVLDRNTGATFPSGKVLDAELKAGVVMVVCDGMGGAAAGEVASRMAIERMAADLAKDDLTTAAPDQVATLMDNGVQQANREIFEKARSDTEHRGMGTTLTAAIVMPGRVFVSQVGDSRAYLLRKGFLNQLTKDQSLVGQLVEEGTLTEEEAEKIGAKNIVLQAVGNEETLRVDTKHWPLLRGDVLLLCSDGLSGMVKDARMREILTGAGDDLRSAADQLIAEANQNGGRDNITVILARFEGEGLRAPLETDATGEMEMAGASFRAPPPPEVPNPMKKVTLWGVILLAVIAAVFLALRRTTAQIVGSVAPANAKVVLVPKAGEPRDGKVVGGRLTIDEVAKGAYEVLVSAEKYGGARIPVTVDEPGVVDLREISLRPNPGRLVLKAGEPVTVTLALAATHPEDGKDPQMQLPPTLTLAAGEVRTFEGVPAGKIRIAASRDGFTPYESSAENGPEFEQNVQIPALAERKGKLVVRGVEGATLRVTTTTGDELVAPTEVSGAAWEGDVRAVAVRVTVTRAGYRFAESEPVTVAEGSRTEMTVQARAITVKLTVEAPHGWYVALTRMDAATGAWGKAEEIVSDKGWANFGNKEPGKYRAQSYERTPSQEDPSKEFEIKAGETDCKVQLEKR